MPLSQPAWCRHAVPTKANAPNKSNAGHECLRSSRLEGVRVEMQKHFKAQHAFGVAHEALHAPSRVILMVMEPCWVSGVGVRGLLDEDFGRRTCAGPEQSDGICVPSAYQGHRQMEVGMEPRTPAVLCLLLTFIISNTGRLISTDACGQSPTSWRSQVVQSQQGGREAGF